MCPSPPTLLEKGVVTFTHTHTHTHTAKKDEQNANDEGLFSLHSRTRLSFSPFDSSPTLTNIAGQSAVKGSGLLEKGNRLALGC